MKAALEAGVNVAKAVGTVQSEIVIPRPSEKLLPKFPLDPIRAEKKSAK